MTRRRGPDSREVVRVIRDNVRLLGQLVPAGEVCRQESSAGGALVVRGPEDVHAYLGPELADLAQEQLRVVLLNAKSRLLGVHLVYQGGVNTIVVQLGDCFREAVRVGAAAVILVHNHPSGDPEPSPEDVRLTAEAAHAGELLGIELVDHLVVAGAAYASLLRRGLYKPAAATTAD